MGDLSAFRLPSTQKHVAPPAPSQEEVVARIQQLGMEAVAALNDVIAAADAVGPDEGRLESMTREELIHDIRLTQEQVVLLSDAMAKGALARGELYADRTALLKAITIPASLTEFDRSRLRALGVNL